MTLPPLARVVLWMTGTLLSFSVMAVSVRMLAGALNIFEILAIRNGVALIVLFALLALRPELRLLIKPARMQVHFVRNTVHYLAQYCWALALTLLPMATVFALEFTMPAWTVPLAVWLLGEKLSASRIGVVVLGLIGVLIILRPGFGAFNPASLLVLLAALGFAIVMISTKMLTSDVSTFAIVFWMSVIQLPIAFIGADPLFLAKLSAHHIVPLLGIGIAGLTSHYCLSNAFRAGDATLVVPLDFMRIPLIAVVGWLLYGEALDIFVFAGALVIIAGVLWNMRSESAKPH